MSKQKTATTKNHSKRFGSAETANFERYEGAKTLDALRPAQNTSLQMGEFHIGGHMHGSSDKHVDQLAAWKVVITRDGQKLEFTSGSGFDSMDKRAKPVSSKP